MPAERIRQGTERLSFLIREVGPGKLAMLGLLMVVASATEGLGLLLLVPITQVVAGGGDIGGFSGGWFGEVARWPLAVLLGGFVTLVSLRAAIVYAVTVARRETGLSLTRRLRNRAHEAILSADWRWLSAQRSADHAAMIVSESARIGSLADRALDILTGVLTTIALLAAALYVSWPLTLITLALGLAAAAALSLLRLRQGRDGDEYYDAFMMLQGHVSDGLTHLRAARLAGAQEALAGDFDRTARRLYEAEMRYNRISQGARSMLQVIAAIVLAGLVFVALRVLVLPIALVVPVLAIFARIVPIVTGMQEGVRSWRFCQPALDAMLALIAEAHAHAEPRVATGVFPPLRDRIELRDVSYAYAGRAQPVFRDFSCVIRAGSIVGVSGPSGSGKSTLADLVSGLVTPDRGEIRVDGVPLAGENRIRWRRQVAYVEQTPFLLDGTIAQNIGWGAAEADREAIERALRAASAQFVLALPLGLETLVGERGRQLSGGERQRISLARALLRSPSLLILDEVTSALDQGNEQSIIRTIAQLKGSCTILVLGHHTPLLALADDFIDLGGDANVRDDDQEG